MVAWLSARSAGGRFTLRIEDLDAQRVVPELVEEIAGDLAWLGIDFDASPALGGPHAPYLQSERYAHYEAALAALHATGRLFPCRVSRRDLRNLASAPHSADHGTPYPAHLRPDTLDPDWFDAAKDTAIRFMVPSRTIAFDDLVCSVQSENTAEVVGDFVLRRRDGLFAYQLAVVVDDLQMGITEVVRGDDLLSSTARQLLLIDALRGKPPRYAHVPLVLNAKGEKLSKRDQAVTLRALREAGVRPETLVGYLAYSLGLVPAPAPQRLSDLVQTFAWSRLSGAGPWRLPRDWTRALCYPSVTWSG